MDRAPLELENAKLRHLLTRCRIHMDSAARKAGKDGRLLMMNELQALAEEIREALRQERDDGRGRISAYDHAAVGGRIERLK